MINEDFVSVDISENYSYPSEPFNPPKVFKEFGSSGITKEVDVDNSVYSKVRNVLIDLKLDEKNNGTKNWNPFTDFINKGDSIVIKPNLVRHVHPLGKKGVISMITHASVIRPVIDYILLAVGTDNTITICDVPLQDAKWETIIRVNGLYDLVQYYKNKGVNIKLLDLRKEISYVDDEGIIVKREIKERDPKGYVSVDLGDKSELTPIIAHYKQFEITDYKIGTVSDHHNPSKNEYYIAKTILNADVLINVPKLKTHKKAGITCAMKNIIGINGDKSWLAHHRSGSVSCCGDEYPVFKFKTWFKWHFWAFLKSHKILLPFANTVKKTYQKVFLKGKTVHESIVSGSSEITEGSWYGNDTLWRCIKDLNKIIFYADKDGMMQIKKQRRYFCIVDGIIAGEKEGPMHHLPKDAGIIIGGFNPVAVDCIAAQIMGFDWKKIPQIREGFKNNTWDLVSFVPDIVKLNKKILPVVKFKPSSGWVNHIEK